MIHLLISIFLIVLFARIILRLIFRPFRRRYRPYGYGNPYGYGYNDPYGYRRPRFGFFPIVILAALDRLFGRRY
jgi:hypothetical protein